MHPSQQTSRELLLTGGQPGVTKTPTFLLLLLRLLTKCPVPIWLLYAALAAARDRSPVGEMLTARRRAWVTAWVTGWGWSPFCTRQESCARGELRPTATAEAGHCLLSLDRKRQLQNPAAAHEQPFQLVVISCAFWPTEPALSSAALMPPEGRCGRRLSPCISSPEGR